MKRVLLATVLASAVCFAAIEDEIPAKTETTISTGSPLNFALEFQYAGLVWLGFPVDGAGMSHTGHGRGGRIAFEYIPITTVGHIGIGVGLQANGEQNIALGGGRFTSIISMPFDLSLSYRAVYTPTQAIVPFLKAGVGLIGMRQSSKTGGPDVATQVEETFNYGGGLEISFNAIDRQSGKILDQSFGVNAVYLILEYRRAEMIGPSLLNLAHDTFSAGLRFDL